MRNLTILIIAVLFVGSVGTVAYAGQLKVTGQGKVASIPDMATITLGVTSHAKTAAGALLENSTATGEVLKQVATAAIKPRDVQTSGLNLTPRWKNSSSSNGKPPTIIGYVVSNQVTIRVRELAELGQVLNLVINNGANTFHGLQFGLQHPQPAKDEARKRAVTDAKRKAVLYSEAAGVKLGPITEISEQSGGGSSPVMMHGMAMSEAVPIAEGEVSVSASINMVFEISD